MRLIFISILLLVTTLANSQTKKETIDWVNAKFGKKDYKNGIFNSFRTLRINEDGTYIITEKDNSSINGKYIAKHTYNGSISELGVNSVFTKKINDDIYIYASCFNKNKCIKYKNFNPDGTQVYESSEDFVLFIIIGKYEDQSLITRSKRALNHLIYLFGGKKEAF